MTEAQIAAYLETPNLCPFCLSEDIVGGSMEHETGYVSQRITCAECDEVWWDIYKLVDVTEES